MCLNSTITLTSMKLFQYADFATHPCKKVNDFQRSVRDNIAAKIKEQNDHIDHLKRRGFRDAARAVHTNLVTWCQNYASVADDRCARMMQQYDKAMKAKETKAMKAMKGNAMNRKTTKAKAMKVLKATAMKTRTMKATAMKTVKAKAMKAMRT